MRIILIAALAENYVIGQAGKLPWHLPADLKYFKNCTLGKPIVMGRKCYEAIGRPLPERKNIILTRDKNYVAPGCLIARSIAEALTFANHAEEMMIIGGAEIYKLFLDRATHLYLTFIHAGIPGDVFFPEWDKSAWREVGREAHPADAKNPYPYSFVVLERKG